MQYKHLILLHPFLPIKTSSCAVRLFCHFVFVMKKSEPFCLPARGRVILSQSQKDQAFATKLLLAIYQVNMRAIHWRGFSKYWPLLKQVKREVACRYKLKSSFLCGCDRVRTRALLHGFHSVIFFRFISFSEK